MVSLLKETQEITSAGMDELLASILVCPRDGTDLRQLGAELQCAEGHRYSLYDGIPVMLLDDVEQTAWWATASIEKAKQSPSFEDCRPSFVDGIDSYVQTAVAATSGYLYKPLKNQLKSYPIPSIRLPDANGDLLLDVGCNWGRWSIAAARKGYRVVGIDPSLEGVLAAGRVAKQLNVECSFVVADARYLPFRRKVFNVAFSYSVLQHLSKENAKMALESVASTLKEDGVCLVQMPNRFGIRSLYHLARRRFAEGKAFDVRYYSIPELKSLFDSVFGNARTFVDGYFGLGIQSADIALLLPHHRVVVRTSELLRKASDKLPWMKYLADSIYVTSCRSAQTNCQQEPVN